jgi:hypothetical protein
VSLLFPRGDSGSVIIDIGFYCHSILAFLWAVANGFSQNVSLSDPPDTQIFHAKGQEVMEEIFGRATMNVALTTPATTATAGGQTQDITAALLPALVQNLTASTALFLKTVNLVETCVRLSDPLYRRLAGHSPQTQAVHGPTCTRQRRRQLHQPSHVHD